MTQEILENLEICGKRLSSLTIDGQVSLTATSDFNVKRHHHAARPEHELVRGCSLRIVRRSLEGNCEATSPKPNGGNQRPQQFILHVKVDRKLRT